MASVRDQAYKAKYRAKMRGDAAMRGRQNAHSRAYTLKKRKTDPSWVEKSNARNRAYRAASIPEAAVELHLCELVAAAGGMAPKFKDPGRHGAPDRLVILPGHPTYYVELKRPRGGKLASWQARYHEDLRACGQRVWVLNTKTAVNVFMAEVLV